MLGFVDDLEQLKKEAEYCQVTDKLNELLIERIIHT